MLSQNFAADVLRSMLTPRVKMGNVLILWSNTKSNVTKIDSVNWIDLTCLISEKITGQKIILHKFQYNIFLESNLNDFSQNKRTESDTKN